MLLKKLLKFLETSKAENDLSRISETIQTSDPLFITITKTGSDSSGDFVRKGQYRKDPSLVRIVIPSGINHIEADAFQECPNLEEVVIEGATVIGHGAFRGCTALRRVFLGQKLETIEHTAFADCQVLNEVIIPYAVKEIQAGAFYGCHSLSGVTFEGLPEKITSSAFDDTPWFAGHRGFVVAGNTLLGFSGEMPGNYSLEIPDNVVFVAEFAFRGCDRISAVTCTAHSHLKTICDFAFENCSNLNRISLPEGLEEIGANAFSNCKGLQEVRIPETVRRLGEYAFYCCTQLTDVMIPEKLSGFNVFLGTEYGRRKKNKKDSQRMISLISDIEKKLVSGPDAREALALWNAALRNAFDELKTIKNGKEPTEDEKMLALDQAFLKLREDPGAGIPLGDEFSDDCDWFSTPPAGQEWLSLVSILLSLRSPYVSWGKRIVPGGVHYNPQAAPPTGTEIHNTFVLLAKEHPSARFCEALETVRKLSVRDIIWARRVEDASDAGVKGKDGNNPELVETENGKIYKIVIEWAGYSSADIAMDYYRRYLSSV